MKKKTFIGIALSTMILSLVWIILTPLLFPDTSRDTVSAAAHPGFLAPEFTLPTPLGEPISLSDYEGQPVLVFLWASWCSVCKSTMPGLQQVYEAYEPQGFTILAVNTTYQDTLSSAINYFQSQGYTYTLLLDQDGSVSRNYQLHALPTSVLVSPDGRVLDVVIGSGLSEGFLRAWLDDFYTDQE